MKGERNGQGIEEVISQFSFGGEIVEIEVYGSGHINDTYRLHCRREDGTEQCYILQRMNTEIFKNPVQLMENVVNVTRFLRTKIEAQGGNPERETLNIVPTRDGYPYFKDSLGRYWRTYLFITDSFSYDQAETAEDFYQSALAFGHFQHLLSDYPAKELYETIPDFHNTVKRFEAFKKAVQEDACKRKASVQNEIRFVMEREEMCHILGDLQKKGELPLRVTHNDTKLNNVLIDKVSGKGLCVIDLDTVMPGLSVNDFGDSIRFGASTAAEDEKDLSKVSCDLGFFEVYAKGFLESCGSQLTAGEIAMLPMGAKVMTFECGMRFLTDYLEGDLYFKIHREGQNLDRCRTQFKLVADMEAKWEQMGEIIEKLSKEI